MSDRHAHILDAASRIFSRYGVGKTTMADIATEAGVARQTVYNAYPTKEDLLRAVVRTEALTTEAKVIEAWRSATTFEDKLEQFFQLCPLKWYDIVHQSPDAAALIDGIHRVATVEMQEAAERWRAHFALEIETHVVGPAINVPALADFIYSTAINAKVDAVSRAQVEARLTVLKQSVMALISSKNP
jgi:AcrR family transcriptional regulator